MSWPERFALVDLETTGANPVTDRITEIAVLRVEQGVIVERWQSLVNPEVPIPGMIQRLIGITDEMVAQAPSFAALADGFRALLQGCVFVAHNARFDYGFIRNAYARIGQAFDAPVLCTVKLSRALYPQHHRHGLDALIERYGFVCGARHRAMGDAEVLWQFVNKTSAECAPDQLEAACVKAMKAPMRPPDLPEGMVEGLPDAPGVYLFFGEHHLPLYIGKSVSLRARVMEHFSAVQRKGREAELARQIKRVEWHETAGELEASLLEAQLIKARRPVHNRQLRSGEGVFALRLLPKRKRPPILERISIDRSDPAQWGEDLYGCFRTRKESDAMLRELASVHRLCLRRLGLEPGGKGACASHQMKRCAGVCAGVETGETHDARLRQALASSRMKPWPWSGAVVVSERNPHVEREVHHLLDRWCLLGSAGSQAQLQALLAAPPTPAFDLDVCRILQRWLAQPEHLIQAIPIAKTWAPTPEPGPQQASERSPE